MASTEDEDIEGLNCEGDDSWGDYPIDDLLIRQENRTIHDVIRRINKNEYIMDPDFQRDFIWRKDKQSKLIESVIMRIPLPVFYMAEDEAGRMVVVDGLQRLSTFRHFLTGGLKLRLPARTELHGKQFSDLPVKLQNRIEDCNLTFYTIDSKVPERARLDIFERVNGGVALTRQQMRNSLFMGPATRFLKEEAQTEVFREATGASLKSETMRDREFINRFCAFQLLDIKDYRGDMDDFLAKCLTKMNMLRTDDLAQLSNEFQQGLTNNLSLFKQHAFRKHEPAQARRSPLNASLWDVMSTGLSRHTEDQVAARTNDIRQAMHGLFKNEDFNIAITYGPNDPNKVRARFDMTRNIFREILGADPD